jgi:hypothetical protein
MLALSLLLWAWPFLALLIHLIRLLQPGPNSPVVCYFWYWLAEFRITEKFMQSCYLMESWRMLLNFENRSPHSLLLLKVCGSCRLWAFFSFRASHWFLFRRRLASWWLQWPHPTCPTSQEITLPSTFKNFSGAGMLEFIIIHSDSTVQGGAPISSSVGLSTQPSYKPLKLIWGLVWLPCQPGERPRSLQEDMNSPNRLDMISHI